MIEVLLGMIFFVLLCNTVGVWGDKNKIKVVDGKKRKKKKKKTHGLLGTKNKGTSNKKILKGKGLKPIYVDEEDS